jgi:CHAT domain-containing protein
VSIDTAGDGFVGAESHGRAVEALLHAHKGEDFEEAISLFEAAIRESGTPSAELLSDFAAALMVRAQALDQPADLARGLERASEAAARDPTFAPAQFNLALLCRELGLKQCESRAWQGYLSLDPVSAWAGEARQYQAALVSPAAGFQADVPAQLSEAVAKADSVRLRHLASSFPATAEKWVADELLGDWAAAVEQQDPRAESLLAEARSVAEQTGALRHRRPLSSALEAVSAAFKVADKPARLEALVRGHLAYSQGSRGARKHGCESAGPLYHSAYRALQRGGSSFALAAELEHIACLVRDSRFEEGLATLRRLEQQHGDLSGVLGGRASWLRAHAETQLRRPLEAVGSFRRASELYRGAGDRSNAINVGSRLAELLDHIEQQDEAWRIRIEGLQGLEDLEPLARRPFVLGDAAEAALRLDLGEAALLFLTEEVLEARRSGDTLALVEALRQSAGIHLRSHRYREALTAFKESQELAAELPGDQTQQAVGLKLREVEGRVALATDPALALVKFDAAIESARKLEQPLYLPGLLLERAEALEALDNREEMRASLLAAVELIEEEWESTLERRTPGSHEALWPTYFGSRRWPLDRLIRKLGEAGDLGEALNIAEKARAREVLDLLRDPAPLQAGLASFFSGRARPLATGELLARLPGRTAVVEYVLAEGDLLAWVVGHDGVRFFDAWPVQKEVEEVVRTLAQDVRSTARPVEIQERLALLFDRLVAPFATQLRPLERLVFVPDGALHAVPFAALYDRGSRHYLVEDHPVATAPSATLYAYSATRDRELATDVPPSVLAVGDPAFDQAQFPQYSRLEGAAAECRAVADQYPSAEVPAPELATGSYFKTALGRATVVHFAGHAVGHPSAAYLLMARGSGEGSGALYASELLAMPPGPTRVVFLSACSSGGEQAGGGQGVAALVRPLIGAGIPAVVGTLWPVDDGAALELATAFHRHLLSGKDAAAALQAAQLELLRDEQIWLRLPQSWAAFQLVGHASLQGRGKEE